MEAAGTSGASEARLEAMATAKDLAMKVVLKVVMKVAMVLVEAFKARMVFQALFAMAVRFERAIPVADFCGSLHSYNVQSVLLWNHSLAVIVDS